MARSRRKVPPTPAPPPSPATTPNSAKRKTPTTRNVVTTLGARKKSPSPAKTPNSVKRNSPAKTPNSVKRNSPAKTPNSVKKTRSKNAWKRATKKIVKALRNKKASAVLATVNVPPASKMGKILMGFVPKIQKLSLRGIVSLIIIMVFNYIVFKNPRFTNNLLDDSFGMGKWPGRILYMNKGTVQAAPGFQKKWMSMNSWVRWYKGPTPADMKLADTVLQGWMKSLPENKNSYGRSRVGQITTLGTYILGLIMLILAYFPHREKEAFDTLVSIFKFIGNFAPIIYAALEKQILHELGIQATKRTAEFRMAWLLFTEVYKGITIGGTLGPKAYLTNVAKRYGGAGVGAGAVRVASRYMLPST